MKAVRGARSVSSGRWRLKIVAACLPLLVVLYISYDLSSNIASEIHGQEQREAGPQSLADRTSTTGSEHISMLLTQWTYFRYLNPQLLGPFLPFIDETARRVLATEPQLYHKATSAAATQAVDSVMSFVTGDWDVWFRSLWDSFAASHGGPQPSMHQLCGTNIMLRYAPWCGYERSLVHEELGGGVATSRAELQQIAARVLQGSSKPSSLSADDAAMIRGIRWKDWNDGPVKPGDVSGAAPAGMLRLVRTRRDYPVLLAMRKPHHTRDSSHVFDSQKRLVGFHACMFGSRRNISSTIGRIEEQLLATTRPQRLHIVTSADGIDEYPGYPEDVQRAMLFSSMLEHVSRVATSFVATERDLPTTLHKCVICRGFFPREVCRASIVGELALGIPVEMVMIFRPDMYMWNPVHLLPYINDVDVAPDDALALHADTRPTLWRLHTKPLWSLVVDKGFLPTTFGVYNDINITKSMIVVHCRVTLPLDLHWIGDPVVLGHWNIMNHWLECFSVITSSARMEWVDENAGELHHAAFYRQYIRPLFELGHEAGAVQDELELRLFDFQFSLFRADPIMNAQLMALTPNYVAYQQQTIFRKFATKWEYGECMRYYFVPRQFNVSSFYYNPHIFFFGEIGRVKMVRMPQKMCTQVRTPPGIQTCFAQYQRIVFYKKGKNVHNPCKPYCGVFPLITKEGMCAHVGNKGPRQRYIATFSTTPMFRNESGEVLRFNLVNPQYVRGDTLWFEKQKAKEEARREQEEREKRLGTVAAEAKPPPLEKSSALEDVGESPAGAEYPESFTRPSVGVDGEPIRETKKPRRYRFVRGKAPERSQK